MDYAGPKYNHMFLVIIDAHSKWIEAYPTTNATASSTVEKLRTLFAQFGLPRTVVSDNGPCFKSEEFKAFLKKNGIQHVTTDPYHPSSNGLAERAVRVVKEGLQKMKRGTISDKLARFLYSYRNTPHSTTGIPPAELLFGRRLQSRLDLLKPSLESRVEYKQAQQKNARDRCTQGRTFPIDTPVYVRNFGQGDTWIPGIVTAKLKSLSYEVELENGKRLRRHLDHIRSRTDTEVDTQIPSSHSSTTWADSVQSSPDPPGPQVDPPEESSTRRYPLRDRHPPDRLVL